jgi:hypothetical protein
MFDLEQSIAEWRKQMLAAGIKTPVPLEELEIHLREEIERQMKLESNFQTAFETARRKIGEAGQINMEFTKVAAAKAVRYWEIFERFFLASTLLIPLIVAAQAFIFKSDVFSEMSRGQQTSIFAAALVFSLCAWIMWLAHQKFPPLRTRQIRDAILVPVVFWVLISAFVIIPRFNFTEIQTALASMWAIAPFGILIGWAWGFATAARKNLAAQ